MAEFKDKKLNPCLMLKAWITFALIFASFVLGFTVNQIGIFNINKVLANNITEATVDIHIERNDTLISEYYVQLPIHSKAYHEMEGEFVINKFIYDDRQSNVIVILRFVYRNGHFSKCYWRRMTINKPPSNYIKMILQITPGFSYKTMVFIARGLRYNSVEAMLHDFGLDNYKIQSEKEIEDYFDSYRSKI